MVKSRRVFTREFKLAAVKELESGKPIGYVARQLEVNANTLDRWRREFRAQPTKAFSGQGRRVLGESREDRKSTRLNSSHVSISYAVFCLKKKKQQQRSTI